MKRAGQSIIRKDQPCTICGKMMKAPRGGVIKHGKGFAHMICAMNLVKR